MIEMKSQPIELQVTLARNIRDRRRELGLTQVELAKRLGISQPAYSALEKGDYAARIDTLARLAEALETTPADLLMAEKYSASGS